MLLAILATLLIILSHCLGERRTEEDTENGPFTRDFIDFLDGYHIVFLCERFTPRETVLTGSWKNGSHEGTLIATLLYWTL